MEETVKALAGLKFSTPEGSKFSEITASGNSRQHNGNVYGGVINNYHAPAEHSKAPEERKGNKHFLVRRRPNNLFVGQETVLADLEKCLLPNLDRDEFGSSQYVLQGIGGVGKSEIALQFAHRHRKAFWGVFWIDFGSTDAARLGFVQIANKCGWPIDSGGNAIDDVVIQLSNSEEPWLLLLDNCDDPGEDYSKYFPSSPQGAVIMTTRLDLEAQYGTTGYRKLDGLDPDNSIKLLAKTANLSTALTEEQRSAAKDVVERLGYHALAITVAGSVLKAGLHSLEEYAQVLVQKEAELLQIQPKQAQSTYGTVHATFEVSAQRLQECGEDSAKHALELLGILAFLDRTNVTEALFIRAWKYGTDYRENPRHMFDCTDMADHSECRIAMLSPWHFNTALNFSWASSTDMSLFRKARNRLHELSLITWTPEDDTISMHPLPHSWARNRLTQVEKVSAWHTTAATLVLSTGTYIGWRAFTYPLQRQLEVCFDLRIEGAIEFVCPLDLCRILYFFWWQLCRADSHLMFEMSKEIGRMLPASLDEESDTMLEICRMRVVVLRLEGDLPAAITLGRKIVSARLRTGSPEGHKLRSAQASLARNLSEAGEYQASVDILEGVKRVEDEIAHVRPGDRCSTLRRLASAYQNIGRTQESLELLKEVIAIRKQFMEAESPKLLAARHELGRAYLTCGEAEKAVDVLEDVVRIRERNLAPENEDRLTSQHVLGKAYMANDQNEKAVTVLEEVVRVRERTLAPEHKDRLSSQHELARAYMANDRNEKAIVVLEEVVRIQQRTQVPEHAGRLASEHELARALLANTDSEKAVTMLEEIVRIREHILVPENEDRLISQHDLARAYRANGQVSKAIPILEHVVDFERRVRSPGDQDRYVSEELLFLCYIDDSQNQKARQLLDDMKTTSHLTTEKHQERLQKREKALLTLEHEIAGKYKSEGRLVEAIELLEHVVRDSKELLPAENQDRLESENRLLSYYIKASRTSEARRLLDQMKETSHLLSEQDRGYLQRRKKELLSLEHHVAMEHFDQGRFDEAIGLMERVVDGREECFGAENEACYSSQAFLLTFYIVASRTLEARRLLGQVKEKIQLMSAEGRECLEKFEKDLEELEEQEWLSTDDSEDGQTSDGERVSKVASEENEEDEVSSADQVESRGPDTSVNVV